MRLICRHIEYLLNLQCLGDIPTGCSHRRMRSKGPIYHAGDAVSHGSDVIVAPDSRSRKSTRKMGGSWKPCQRAAGGLCSKVSVS